MQLWLCMAGVQTVKSNLRGAVGLRSVLCFEICSKALSIADKLAYFLGVVLQGLGRTPAKVFGKAFSECWVSMSWWIVFDEFIAAEGAFEWCTAIVKMNSSAINENVTSTFFFLFFSPPSSSLRLWLSSGSQGDVIVLFPSGSRSVRVDRRSKKWERTCRNPRSQSGS